MDEAGEKQGFTRFGAWNGSAYGDWNAAFTAFCLRYAGVSSGAFPAKNEAWSWLEALSARGLYADRGPVQPAPGDLLFADTDGDGIADRVGIVAKVGSGITAIEGDVRGEAAFVNYGGDDDRVLGFGLLNAAWANHAGVKTEAKEEIKEESSTASPGSSAPARNTPCPRAA